jgi:hypothetical protein
MLTASSVKIEKEGKTPLFNIQKLGTISEKKENFQHGRWTQEEHFTFIDEVMKNGIRNWKRVIKFLYALA